MSKESVLEEKGMEKYIAYLGLVSLIADIIIIYAWLYPQASGDWISLAIIYFDYNRKVIAGLFQLLLAGLFVGFVLYQLVFEPKKRLEKVFRVYKSVKKLTLEDFSLYFGLQFPEKIKNKGYYLERKFSIIEKGKEKELDEQKVEELLKKRGKEEGKPRGLLVTGKPKMGKTRTCYNIIKKFEDYWLLVPKNEKIDISEIKVPKKRTILFFNDLQTYLKILLSTTHQEQPSVTYEYIFDVRGLVQKIASNLRDKDLIVLANCRTGLPEMRIARAAFPELLRELKEVELKDITEGEAKKLAEEAGVKWKGQYDGTPGTVILDFNDMRNRYDNLPETGEKKKILHTIKLLIFATIFEYGDPLVKQVAEDVFDFPNYRSFGHIIRELFEDGFLAAKTSMAIYPAYLDEVIHSYPNTDAELFEDLESLGETLRRLNDAKNLFKLANAFYIHVELRIIKKQEKEEKLLKALQHYDKALKLNPEFTAAWYNKADILVELGRLKEALECLDKAIEIDPRFAEAWVNKGATLIMIGRLKEALECLDKAIEINPKKVEAWANKAATLIGLDRPEEALECYSKCLELRDYLLGIGGEIYPSFVDLVFEMGLASLKSGKVDDARNLARRFKIVYEDSKRDRSDRLIVSTLEKNRQSLRQEEVDFFDKFRKMCGL